MDRNTAHSNAQIQYIHQFIGLANRNFNLSFLNVPILSVKRRLLKVKLDKLMVYGFLASFNSIMSRLLSISKNAKIDVKTVN